MGKLIDGEWKITSELDNDSSGKFKREDSVFREWIKADGRTAFLPEAGRYHLYLSYACPWACRTLIFLTLKELHDVISFSVVDPYMGDDGWTFGQSGEQTQDPLYQASHLYKIYLKADANATTKVTVPVLWDKKTQSIVNNESSEIIRMLNAEFNDFTSVSTDYYPASLASEIDEMNQFVYRNINNGVYKCGFASTQAAYEKAFDNLFSALDKLEMQLADATYLLGDSLTEADWRLFTTLIRFDVVYVGHFKCNLRRIADYPALRSYLHRLYHHPGIKATVNFEHIKNHYYQSHHKVNPTGIVPKGPDTSWLDMPL